MVRALYIVVGLFAAVFSIAQDIHFSQFNEHPALINPALTGTNGKYRAYMAYKNQWKSVSVPYKTYAASIEFQPVDGPWKKSKNSKFAKNHREQNIGRLGAGLSVYNDNSGDGKLSTTLINLSIATFVPTGHWSFLSVGVQGTMAGRKIDQNALLFPDQYSGSGYSSSIKSADVVSGSKYNYFDYSAGMLWTYGRVEKNFANNREFRFRLGGSAYHITQPDLKIIGNGAEPLLMKYVGHFDMVVSLGRSQLSLVPSCLYQLQGLSQEIIAGSMIRYFISNGTKFTGKAKSTALNFGVFFRTDDAVIINFLLHYREQYSLGLSYDLNTSPLKQASNLRGGLELTLRLTPQEDYLFRR